MYNVLSYHGFTNISVFMAIVLLHNSTLLCCVFQCSYVRVKGYFRYLRLFHANSTDRIINRVRQHILCDTS